MGKQKIKYNIIIAAIFLLVFYTVQSTVQVAYAATTTTKIMPLGDSITDCDFWRTLLLNKLTVNGYDVKFVGSKGTHEGHSGMLVTDLAATTKLSDCLITLDSLYGRRLQKILYPFHFHVFR